MRPPAATSPAKPAEVDDPPEIRAAKWALKKGGALAAKVCEETPPPRLGCPGAPKAVARAVEAAPISDTNYAIVARYLEGTWRDSSYVLRVDIDRGLANADGPLFDWQGFRVREVSDDQIVFAVGWQLYTAKITDASLVLTSTSFRGEKSLTRAPSG